MAQVICEYCGGLNDDRSTNCSKCGAPLPSAPPAASQRSPGPPPQQPPAQPPQQAQPTAPATFYQAVPVPPRRSPNGCAIAGCSLIALILALVVIGIVASIGNNNGSSNSGKQQPLGTHAVLSLHGSAATRTRPFEVNRYWDVVWSYNCEGRAGQPAFNVRAHLIGDPELLDWKLDQHAVTGSGRQHFERSGTYWLDVKTHCRWAIKALDNP